MTERKQKLKEKTLTLWKHERSYFVKKYVYLNRNLNRNSAVNFPFHLSVLFGQSIQIITLISSLENFK